MIELTVENKTITVYKDEEISIESNSPVFDDDNGAFSFPFAVPTKPNRVTLGFPGRLQRKGKLPEQSFVLKNDGLTVLKGSVSFDQITKEDTGLVLHSGKSDFNTRMDGLLLSDLDFGSENWVTTVVLSIQHRELVNRWNDKHAHTKNEPMKINQYVMAPFAIKNSSGEYIIVNEHIKTSNGTTELTIENISYNLYRKYYCMQFQLSWVLRTIFTSLGYSIVDDEFSGHDIEQQCVLFGKIIRLWRFVNIAAPFAGPKLEDDILRYADVMPDVEVLDFIDAVKNICGLAIHINETTKEVSILLKNNIVASEEKIKLTQETEGYEHNEPEETEGYSLTFASQSNDEATLSDFSIFDTVTSQSDLPAVTKINNAAYQEQIVYVSSTDRYYKCILEDDAYTWSRVAWLKPVVYGGGENEIEIKIKVPEQRIITDPANYYQLNSDGKTYKVSNLISGVEMPYIDYSLDESQDFQDMGDLIISLYHGQALPGSTYYPFVCFDNYTLSSTWGMSFSLRPDYLFEQFYSEFLPWQSEEARKCVKYMKMPLHEVLQLKWNTKYIIDGAPILLSRISYDLPYPGIVELEGYTAY